MKCCRSATSIVLLVLLSCLSAKARQEELLEAYYFFSTACPGCTNSAAFVKKLSKEITVHGFVFGHGDAETMPFKVWKDDEASRRRYDVSTFPTLIIVKNGAEKQMFIGEQDIQDARMFLNAIRKGAWSVSEVAEKKPQNTQCVTGWVISKGAYFHQPRFYLTDRKQSIRVKPWLPLEAVKSPFGKTRPRLMSDVMNTPVLLEGELTLFNDDVQFTVRKEIILE